MPSVIFKAIKYFVSILLVAVAMNCHSQEQDPVLKEVFAIRKKIHQHIDSNKDSLKFYVDVMQDIFKRTGNERANIEYLVYNSEYEKRKGNFTKAVESNIALINATAKDGYWDFQLYALGTIGSLFNQMHDYDMALFYIDSAKTLCDKYGDNGYLMDLFKYEGIAYRGKKQFNTAMAKHQRSLTYAKEQEINTGIVGSYNNIALIYTDLDQLDKALVYYDSALTLAKTTDYKSAVMRAFINIGALYERLGDGKKSIIYFTKADSTQKNHNIGNYSEQYTFALGLARAFQKQGEFDKADEYYERCLRLSDSMKSDNQVDQMKIINTQLEVSKYQTELKLEQQEKRNLALESENKSKWLTIVILVSTIIAIVMAFLIQVLRRRMRIKAKSEQEAIMAKQHAEKQLIVSEEESETLREKLKNRADQLTDLALSVQSKNEILDQLKEDISKLKADDGSVNVDDLYQSLVLMVQTDRDRDLLNLHIDEVHQDFNVKLKSYSEDLSDNEVKLCGLIRLGMSSKDISALLGYSLGSVETYRYKIRKKLKLDKDASLSVFLSDL